MQIVDIIKYDGNDNNKQWLIYKYPSDEFVLGSQLIVNQGQEALTSALAIAARVL